MVNIMMNACNVGVLVQHYGMGMEICRLFNDLMLVDVSNDYETYKSLGGYLVNATNDDSFQTIKNFLNISKVE